MRLGTMLRRMGAVVAAGAFLASANAAVAQSAGCNAINDYWGGGVTFAAGDATYSQERLQTREMVSYWVTSTGTVSGSESSFNITGLPGVPGVSGVSSVGAELAVSGSLTAVADGYLIIQTTASSAGTVTLRATCSANAPMAANFAANAAYNDTGSVASQFSAADHMAHQPVSYAVTSPTSQAGGSVSMTQLGDVTYVPPMGFRGPDSFQYTVTDTFGTSAPATVSVMVGNPTFSVSLPSPLASVGVPYNPGGTPLTIVGGKPDYLVANVQGLPPGVDINPVTQVLYGTPALSGSYTVTFSIFDSSSGYGPHAGSASAVLTVNGGLAATVTSINPGQGPVAGGGIVTITGTDLLDATGVDFGGVASTSFGVFSATSMWAEAPPASGPGFVDVTVHGAYGPGTLPSAYRYFRAPLAPTLLSAPPAFSNSTYATFHVVPEVGTALYGALDGDPLALVAIPTTFFGLLEGPHTARFLADDGERTGAELVYSWIVDLTSPAEPVILAPAAGAIMDIQPVFSGTAEAGSTVTVLVDGYPVGTTTATLAGDWTYDATPPLASGSHTISGTATDAAGNTSPPSMARSFTVGAPTITLTPSSLTGATVGVPYSQTITSSGGVAPYSYEAISGALAPGLSLSSGGVISGTPTAGGVFNFAVRTTDSSSGPGPFTGTMSYTLTVGAPLVAISPTFLPAGVAGTTYGQTISASGGVGPYSYAVTAGDLPAGWSLSATGELSGEATSTGNFNFTITATDSSSGAGPYTASRAYTVNVGTPNFTLTPPTLSATQGEDYTGAFVAGGGTAPYAYSYTGDLPPGLTLSSDGVLSGRPTASGSYNFIVVARDSTTGLGAPHAVASSFNFSVAVATPPVASALSATVAYDAPTNLDLAPAVSGAHTSIAVVSSPLHGTVAISGAVATYTPHARYFGPDSFTYAATGPGGTSAPATVTITVATPAAPTAGAFATSLPYDDPGLNATLSAFAGGVFDSFAIATPPSHGVATITGDTLSYVAHAGFVGTDTFTYTATGPGGTSAPATVTITVATPNAPTVADRNGVVAPYNGAGTAIDLSGSITGVHSSIAVQTGATRGGVSVSGAVATYTPPAGYHGPDNFTYTATGPGGTSAPATVTITVSAPAAPVAQDSGGVAVSYNSAGATIDLSGLTTGVYASFALATPPAHGTASLSGAILTYRPAADYHGEDAFTWTATGPGGVSNVARVGLTVAPPPPPVVTPPQPVVVEPTQGGGPTSVDLSAITSGVLTGFSIEQAPTGGQVSIAPPASGGGWRLVYTPAPNFMGADVVTVVGQGPGGSSAPADFTFQVLGKAPDLQGVSTDGEVLTFRPTQGLTGGPFQALVITQPPTIGSAQVVGLTIVYDPEGGAGTARLRAASVQPAAAGQASFAYAVVLPFGQSQAGTIDVEAIRTTPELTPLTATTLAGRPVTVSLTDTATRGPFTGAAVVAVSDDAGAAVIRQGGAAGAPAYELTFTPAGDFVGQAVVTYTLSNAGGATQGRLLVTVDARPDPSADPEVRALISAQVDTARRFTRAQTDNFHRRLEQVRRGGQGGVSNGLSLNLGDDGRMQDPREVLRQQLGQASGGPSPFASDEDVFGASALGLAAPAAPAGAPPAAAAGKGGGALGVWTAGAIDWGRRDAGGQRDSRFTTSGLSAGVDMAVSDTVILGAGVGYGHDRTRLRDNGSLSEADSYLGAVYGGWRAAEGLVLDGVLGYGSLEYDSRRWSEDAQGPLFGARSGSVLFGSASLALERSRRNLNWAPYARLSFGSITLDGFTETGSDVFALSYEDLDTRTLASALGASFDWTLERRDGLLAPSLRVEWRHEFEGSDDQIVSYADWLASPDYAVGLERWARDSVSLALGLQWRALSGWTFGADYQGQLGSDLSSHGLRLRLQKAF